MVQWGKEPAAKPHNEFDPWDPHTVERENLHPEAVL